MVVLSWVAWGLSVLINLYMMVLFARVILEWIPFFVRGWRPRGILLVVANALYALTDPPVRWIGRFIPPVRIGDGHRFFAVVFGPYRCAALRDSPLFY